MKQLKQLSQLVWFVCYLNVYRSIVPKGGKFIDSSSIFIISILILWYLSKAFTSVHFRDKYILSCSAVLKRLM